MEQFEIKTITPVHVGSGRFLQNKVEYVFSDRSIGIVDERKVFDLLGEERLKQWLQSIESGTSIAVFLKPFVAKLTVDMICSRKIALKCDKEQAKSQSSLKEQLYNGMGHPYIPGSSIKGAIRSAIYNQELLKKETPINFVDSRGQQVKPNASVLEKQLFGNDPNHDVFRFLQIGDAYFEPNSTVATNMVNINIKQNGATKDSSKNQLVEAIGENQSAGFTIKLNQKLLSANVRNGQVRNAPAYLNSIKSLFQTINKNTRLLINEEKDFWADFENDDDAVAEYLEKIQSVLDEATKCSENECILRLGHGSGYTFISGNLVNQESLISEYDYNKIVNIARPENEKNYNDYYFPKTRRIDEHIDLLGFVKISAKQ